MSGKLAGKVVVVTGGNSGIGLATAKAFRAEGAAKVFITGRRQDALDSAVAAIGGNVVGIRADSAKLADLDRVFERVKAEGGHIDVLFANAGGGTMQPLGQISEKSYEDTFGSNVKGVLFTVQKALPLLIKGSSVILTGSTTSIKSDKPARRFVPSSTSLAEYPARYSIASACLNQVPSLPSTKMLMHQFSSSHTTVSWAISIKSFLK